MLRGNELGDMLVYAFLEEVLHAPKLMSAIELVNSGKTASRIHLYSIPGAINTFQLVYGASEINGGLTAAIDNAFESVHDINSNKITCNELVNSAAFNRSIDSSIADQVRQIVLPTKKHHNQVGTAYGMFIGYSIGLNPEDYATEEFLPFNDANTDSSMIIDKLVGEVQ